MTKRQLCKLKKDEVKAILYELTANLNHRQFICKKCARIAHDQELLCKPVDVRKVGKR